MIEHDVRSFGNDLLGMSAIVTVATERSRKFETGDLIVRKHMYIDSDCCKDWDMPDLGDVANEDSVIEARTLRSKNGLGFFYSMSTIGPRHGFGLYFTRRVDAGEVGDHIMAKFFPLDYIHEFEENEPDAGDFKDFGFK